MGYGEDVVVCIIIKELRGDQDFIFYFFYNKYYVEYEYEIKSEVGELVEIFKEAVIS